MREIMCMIMFLKDVYLTLLAKNDKRGIIYKYLQFICETANTKELKVINESCV